MPPLHQHFRRDPLLDAYGVEDVTLGDLDLMPGLKERARAEKGDAPPA